LAGLEIRKEMATRCGEGFHVALPIGRQSRNRLPPRSWAELHVEDETANAERSYGDRQRLSAMQAAVAELPDRQRLSIILSAQQGKSNTEIAAILECSEGAVEQLMVRARKTLRDRYRRLE